MQALMRTVSLAIALVGLSTGSVGAQAGPPPPGGPVPQSAQTDQYSSNEVIDAGHRFFGYASQWEADEEWGRPTTHD